ncbi:hypothetical protein PG993_003163 [Apiospora rasikravindrae]|uniref:Uncharacterized protein n=1 Tax=Apiospora rasikravindrae TaxID=990691 RepID=A0ABR1TYQ0_9PEZI
MQFRQFLSLCLAAELAGAVNVVNYDPEPDVPAEFRDFLEALVGQADNATATDSFTDCFTSTGRQTTLTKDCVGPAAILKCKQGFLPPDGRMTLTHFPNTTFVAEDTADSTVYEVRGRIENNFTAGNCSQIYYHTQYTILKTSQAGGMLPNLTPQPQNQVSWYHDYVITPVGVPSDIPCDSLMQ